MIQFIWLCPQRLTEGCGFSWDPLAAIPDFHLYTGKSQFRFLLLESLFPTPLHCQAESVNSASLGIRLGSCSAPNLCSHSRFVPSKSPQKALWYDENTPLTPSHCGKTDVANIPTLLLQGCFLSHPVFWCCTKVQLISQAEGSVWRCSSPMSGDMWCFRFWDCNT